MLSSLVNFLFLLFVQNYFSAWIGVRQTFANNKFTVSFCHLFFLLPSVLSSFHIRLSFFVCLLSQFICGQFFGGTNGKRFYSVLSIAAPFFSRLFPIIYLAKFDRDPLFLNHSSKSDFFFCNWFPSIGFHIWDLIFFLKSKIESMVPLKNKFRALGIRYK